jgi:hypothetical protein
MPVWIGSSIRSASLAQDSPEAGGTRVAQHCVRAAGKYGSHPDALLPQSRVTDRINPAMNAVQALGMHACSSAALVDSNALELGEGDNAVLVRCKSSDRSVRAALVTFPPHGGR